MAKVNVIMSVFNQEKYVKESIQSILDQNFRDFKLIVINDGSTDESERIIQSFGDNRIKYIANEGNKGLIYSLNRGVALSIADDCEYIARMDSDDISHVDRLLLQVQYLDQHTEVGLLGTAMEFFGINITKRKLYAPLSQKKILSTFYCYNPFFHPTIMLRKQLVEHKRYSENFPKYEDYGLWIDLIGSCEFYNIPIVLLNYRRHQSSVTSTYRDNVLFDQKIYKRLLLSLTNKLKVTLTEPEIEILSLITTAARATINANISLSELTSVITSAVSKNSDEVLDKRYLKSLLIERAVLYLKTNGRKTDILRLLFKLGALNEFVEIALATCSGRKWTALSI